MVAKPHNRSPSRSLQLAASVALVCALAMLAEVSAPNQWIAAAGAFYAVSLVPVVLGVHHRTLLAAALASGAVWAAVLFTPTMAVAAAVGSWLILSSTVGMFVQHPTTDPAGG